MHANHVKMRAGQATIMATPPKGMATEKKDCLP